HRCAPPGAHRATGCSAQPLPPADEVREKVLPGRLLLRQCPARTHATDSRQVASGRWTTTNQRGGLERQSAAVPAPPGAIAPPTEAATAVHVRSASPMRPGEADERRVRLPAER